ncbi:MAG: 30S ribosomal protein S1 [Nitrospirae bacterium]|nr:30S ribosomal protein S1 [Nitrospirota bacterium]MBI3353124.1 30S ribosomal protein S1 [Nitrospirota bacterium]
MSKEQVLTQNKISRRIHDDEDEEEGVMDAQALEMEALYAESFKNLEEGSIVEGTILSIEREGVLVDIGYKSEGSIPRSEFTKEDLEKLKVGDPILVYLEQREDSEGNILLSKEKADKMKVWKDLEKVSDNGEIIEGKILSRIKGGMIVDIGIKAFLPGSQIDLRPVRDLDQLIGKTFPMKIIKMNQKRGNIVVSRRVLLEETRDKKRQSTLSNLTEGQIVPGIVKNITEYGAFIDLGGIDGLLHITDMSWGRVNHPSELFMVGDKIEVVILKYDRETGRVSLGYKQRTPDPWADIESKYAVGTRIRGKIASLTDYGAFVELQPGIEGLVHISEMTWSHEVRHPSKLVAVGDMIDAVVLSLDKKGRKISLGMKQVDHNPWEVIEKKFPTGTKVEGKVRSITDFGVFVGISDGIDGLIHISDLSWTKHIKHPSEIFKKGQKIDAVVLKIDREKERLSLGFKQLTQDPWEKEIPEKFKLGAQVTAKISKISEFGVFVELAEDVEGLIHISELGLPTGQKIEDTYKAGSEITAKVVKIDTGERKIGLSLKEQRRDSENADYRSYMSGQSEEKRTLGSELNKKMNEKE